MNEFDELIEQADQEMIQAGTLSPATQVQLQAVASGKQVRYVDYQGITQWLRERIRRRLQDEEGEG